MYLNFVLAHVNELAMSLSGNIILKSSVTSLQELFEYLDMTTFSAHLTSAWRTDESINILSSVQEVPFGLAVGTGSLLFWKWKSNVEDDGACSLCFFLFHVACQATFSHIRYIKYFTTIATFCWWFISLNLSQPVTKPWIW